jgi:hypothetical protein
MNLRDTFHFLAQLLTKEAIPRRRRLLWVACVGVLILFAWLPSAPFPEQPSCVFRLLDLPRRGWRLQGSSSDRGTCVLSRPEYSDEESRRMDELLRRLQAEQIRRLQAEQEVLKQFPPPGNNHQQFNFRRQTP